MAKLSEKLKRAADSRDGARAAQDKVTTLQENGHTVESSTELNAALDAALDESNAAFRDLPWFLR